MIEQQERVYDKAKSYFKKALSGMANIYFQLTDIERSIELVREALQICQKTGNKRQEGNLLGNLGLLYKSNKDTVQAIHFYREANAINRQVGNKNSEAIILGHMGYYFSSSFYRYNELCKRKERVFAAFYRSAQRVDKCIRVLPIAFFSVENLCL